MGSRRRAARPLNDLESSSTADDSGLQLLPTVKKGLAKYELQDYLGHQKWHVKRKPATHPAVTNYGPTSLQIFMRRTVVQQLPSLDRSQQDLREYALSLVNARSGVCIAKENGEKVIKAADLNASLSSSSGAAGTKTSDRKGKQPLRKSVIGGSTETSSNLTGTGNSSKKSASRNINISTDHLRSRPILLGNVQSQNGWDGVNAVDDSRALSAKPRALSVAGCTLDATVEDSEMAPRPRLSRTVSFENHASSSRGSQRSKEKVSNTEMGLTDGTGRRRKTPAQASIPLEFDVGAFQDDHPSAFNASAFELDNMSILMDRRGDLNKEFQVFKSVQLVEEQEAIMQSFRKRSNQAVGPTQDFDYSRILPEQMPENTKLAEINRCKIWHAYGFDGRGKRINGRQSQRTPNPFTKDQIDPAVGNFLNAPNQQGDYRRVYKPVVSQPRAREPPHCGPTASAKLFPPEFWEAGVLDYLSSAEVRTLRLVCRDMAHHLAPYVFRSVVAEFGPSLFSLKPTYDKYGSLEIDSSTSMLARYGSSINKFGISFECDMEGLMYAPFKETETSVDAWFGPYKWPITDYPYFPALKEIDKLLDDERRLLTQAMKNLGRCSELAISVDSGHGWLEGPDLSDLALYRTRGSSGCRVFGQKYDAPDRAFYDGMAHLIEWGQIRTTNENIKYVDSQLSAKSREELQKLRRILVRDMDSYRRERAQPDYDRHLHTGGQAVPATAGDGQPQNAIPAPANPTNPAWQQTLQHLNTALSAQLQAHGAIQQRLYATPDVRDRLPGLAMIDTKDGVSVAIKPQWPVIFNGFNLAVESRGDTPFVQNRVAPPSDFPLLPGALREAQAQWLMETSWIQRTFLSAYTDAVRVNSNILENVHSLHIAKISSGLLPALSQRAFWTALPGLRKVTLLVKPDWRVEHIPGDKYFESTMASSPINASLKFAELLRDHITRLENLNSLHIGYVGGGEHQKGMFGRNQHILPAPITSNPRDWLLAQNSANPKPNGDAMFVFSHVRTLKFENCWFSPYMLETFMRKSQDTSLHNLVLDSVSMTAQTNSTRADGPLRTVENALKCQHSPSAWLNEVIPQNASWVSTLEKITPGKTIVDKKYDANMINEEKNPRPKPEFRGNIQHIILKSCGYVKILGVGSNHFNQNELVSQNSSWSAMDEGLKVRSCAFSKVVDVSLTQTEEETSSIEDLVPQLGRRRASRNDRIGEQRSASRQLASRFIMLAGKQGHVRGETVNPEAGAAATTMTGFLTQCVHPVEKRILEQMWGMKFGWGDDMARWEAVEDGWFMGGTGRFSGEIFKDNAAQESFIAASGVLDDVDRDTEPLTRATLARQSPMQVNADAGDEEGQDEGWLETVDVADDPDSVHEDDMQADQMDFDDDERLSVFDFDAA